MVTVKAYGYGCLYGYGLWLFMVKFNISDLNTETGKIKCSARNTKKGLNKENIRTNLSKVITDNNLIDQAMQKILNEREITTTYKLTKVKNK